MRFWMGRMALNRLLPLVLILFVGSSLGEPHSVKIYFEAHDVSPLYKAEVERILNELDGLDVLVFVIPNHGGVADLRRHRDFATKLGKYRVVLHGYEHRPGECDLEAVEKGLKVLRAVNLTSDYFAPYDYDYTSSCLEALGAFNLTPLTERYMGGEFCPYREYTWYTPSFLKPVLVALFRSDLQAFPCLRVGVHPRAVDSSWEAFEEIVEVAKRLNNRTGN
ncbi:DUF2334 domain-containing protein [Pyrococcus yayanosii]|uniref:Polysaccharide deacetylase n=1 Tax=Pyrococcus yayanosii (strain CH1 / JCM 16557) TaxID=529709 RepID=F8AHC6_PYRYC|nr:DUF2334 domain-containing protein [Pyrococcus yayanosii]AEH24123.1 polysaccharide deacetylase [Pyrococcus yayanosii CH1]